MSVVRAFTTRRVKQSLQTSELSSSPQRSSTKNASAGGSIRNKISSPVELLHTTNVLAYNAPDLYPNPKTSSSTGSSHRSDDDMSDSAFTAGTTPPTSPDIETSPKRVMNPKRTVSPEPNHLSAYFAVPGRPVEAPARTQAPIIPQRAPSHSKKTYNNLVRQRSASNVSANSQQSASTNASYTFSRSSSSNSTATSTASQVSSSPVQHRMKHSGVAAAAAAAAFVAATPPPQAQRHQHRKEFSESQHPFGPELQQVSEIAEEYGVKEQVNVVDAEEKEMIAKGLLKFTASDYLGEIQGLISSFFVEQESNPAPVATAAWI
ncbi:hypothetical protein QBC44DRAFT_26403 [Cladorrhinum sp. PSN332]|nr:hypothetical protein QBC44DRAFT_26403 [Cladorrhinum sp. PSN332]